MPVEIDGKPRHMVSRGRDASVLRMLEDIVRGIAYHHCGNVVHEHDDCADALKYHVPAELRLELLLR